MAVFAAHLRRYHRECGHPSIRTMERLTRKVGRRYARATIDDKISARSLPDWDFVRTFVLACDLHSGVPSNQLGQSGLDEWRARHEDLLLAVANTGSGVRRVRQAEGMLIGSSDEDEAARADPADSGSNRQPNSVGDQARQPSPHAPILAVPAPRVGDVPRPDLVRQVLGLLDVSSGGVVAMTTALAGAGGFGKTTMARMLVQDPGLRQRFPDGILWVSLSESLSGPDLADRIDEACIPLIGIKPPYTDPILAGAHLGAAIGDRRLLLVIDDVWHASQLEPFRIRGAQTVRLVTTRRRSVLPDDAATVDVDAMTATEARQLLTNGLGEVPESAVARLLSVTGRWPVLLGLINGAAQADVRGGASADQALLDVQAELEASGITALDPEDPDSREQAVSATIAVSLERLTPVEQARFAELAVFPEDLDIPVEVVARFWGHTAGWPLPQTRGALRKLDDLSLLATYRRDMPARVRLHDVIREYLRGAVKGLLREQDAALLYAHRSIVPRAGARHSAWWAAPAEESYVWTWVPAHLKAAGLSEELRDTVLNPSWLSGKLENVGPAALESDLMLVGDSVSSQTAAAVRQNAHLLGPIEPPGSAAATLASRMADGPVNTVCSRLLESLQRPHLETTSPLPDLPHPALQRVLVGHTDAVVALAMTPDAELTASAGHDGQVRVWHTGSDETRRTFSHAGGRAGVLAMAPDGSWLASAEHDGHNSTVRVWDLATGTLRCALNHPSEALRVLGADPAGRWLAAAGEEGRVYLWDTTTGGLLRVLAGHASPIRALAMAPNRTWLASASGDFTQTGDNTICVWDLETGTLRHRLDAHEASVDVLAVAPDGSWLASGGMDGKILVWDTHTGDLLTVLIDGGEAIRALLVADDGRWLASAAATPLGTSGGSVSLWEGLPHGRRRWQADGVPPAHALAVSADRRWLMCGGGMFASQAEHGVRVWDVATGELHETLIGHGGPVRALAVAPHGQWLVSASEDGTVRLWSAPTRDRSEPALPLTVNVSHLAGDADGLWLASADERPAQEGSHVVQLWDVESGAVRRTLPGLQERVRALAAAPDGSWLAAAGDDDLITVWDVNSGERRHTLTANSFWVLTLAVTADSARLVSGGDNGAILMWNVTTGQQIMGLRDGTEPIRALVMPPDQSWLAAAGGDLTSNDDTTVRVWNLRAGVLAHTLRHLGTVEALECAVDGSWLASAGRDGRIRIWDPAGGVLLHTLAGHAGRVSALQAAPDGSWMASAGSDATVRIWDPRSGDLVHELSGHSRPVQALTLVRHSGEWLASAGDDGSIRLWAPGDGTSVAAFNVDGPLVALRSSGPLIQAGGVRGCYFLRLTGLE